jgi:tetratricopeptide (TPR) repeat protein
MIQSGKSEVVAVPKYIYQSLGILMALLFTFACSCLQAAKGDGNSKKWDEDMNSGISAFALHHYDDADRFFLEARKDASTLASPREKEAAILLWLIRVMFDTNRTDDAEAMCTKAIQELKPLKGEALSRYLRNRGLNYTEGERHSDSENILAKTFAAEEQEASLRLYLCSLGQVYTVQKKYSKAEQVLTKAVSLERRLTQLTEMPYENTVDTAAMLLGGLYIKEGKFVQAQSIYERVIPLMKEGALSPQENSRRLIHWVAFYIVQKKYSTAEPLIRQNLAIQETLANKSDLDLVPSLAFLAIVCNEQHKYAEAESALARIVEIRQKNLPENDQEIVRALANLVTVQVFQKHYGDAEPYAKSAIQMCKDNDKVPRDLAIDLQRMYILILQKTNRWSEIPEQQAILRDLETQNKSTEQQQ